jgi:outer membrane protein OmpA-like peptidoglycan-associated protein
MGYPINTSGDEISLIVNGMGTKAYYSSSMKGTLGGQDIYSFELPKHLRPTPVTYFKGTVKDKVTSKPVEARFQMIDLQTQKINADEYSDKSDGTFLIPLPGGKNYALNVSAKGYLFYSENFEMPSTADIKPYEKDVLLSPITEGSTTVLRNVFFETASYALKKESEVELDKLAEFLKLNATVSGEIAGHTDNVGDRKMNQTLSENRAKTVHQYLVNKGIDPARLTFKGYADLQPLVPNDSDVNRAQNRRTEFRITKK